MARREKTIGLIRCRTDAATLNAIAEASGLIAKPTLTPNHFHLINSGRNLACEVEPVLLAAVAGGLDKAVCQGVIPSWSVVEWISNANGRVQ